MGSKKKSTQETLLRCEECGAVGRREGSGWAVSILHEDPEAGATKPDVVFYCPDCAAREFGFIPHLGPSE
jgi:hypothetical protein